MQHLFLDTRPLDARAREVFSLTEDSMMECAAMSLEQEVYTSLKQHSEHNQHILILAGSGNNGGDGYALARRLAQNTKEHGISKEENYDVTVCSVSDPKSEMCKLQKNKCDGMKGISFISLDECHCVLAKQENSDASNNSYCIVVDCIFGSGFHGALPTEIESLITKVNALHCVRIACDVPSGIDQLGNAKGAVFNADVTVTMGAQKVCLYSDKAKDCAGVIKVVDLGISRQQFESGEGNYIAELLEHTDMVLPHRNKQNVNKGSFGHAAIVAGEKLGAAVIAGSSAFRFGAGLVTLVGKSNNVFPGKEIVLDDEGQLPDETETDVPQKKGIVPYDLMCSESFPANTTAVAIGMGLGRDEQAITWNDNGEAATYFTYLNEHRDIACVLDADIFYNDNLYAFLQSRIDKSETNQYAPNVVLTPHPKEFVSLLQKCNLGMYSVSEVIENRIALVTKFCATFPGVVLLLKGAVVTIGVKYDDEKEVRLYVNPYGTNALAKGGSGDVLAGMIAALLAQSSSKSSNSQSALDATIHASLAHAIASSHAPCDFALTPFSLMKLVSEL